MCDEFLRAVLLVFKSNAKKSSGELYQKLQQLASKFDSHLFKVSQGEKPDCWREIVCRNGSCEKFPNKTDGYMKINIEISQTIK